MPVPETPGGHAIEAEGPEDVVHPDDLPFSAGIPPGETDGRALAAKGGAQLLWDDTLLQAKKNRDMSRRSGSFKGKNVLFEYACSDDSVIGKVAAQSGVQCSSGKIDIRSLPSRSRFASHWSG